MVRRQDQNAQVVIVPIEPRCMTREQAAAYCGRTASAFSSWVSRGLVPGLMPGTKTWDRKALDRALDKLSGIETGRAADDPFETWRREYEAENPRVAETPLQKWRRERDAERGAASAEEDTFEAWRRRRDERKRRDAKK